MIVRRKELLLAPMMLIVLASCGPQSSGQSAARTAAQNDVDEVRADVAAVKNSPSLTNPSKFAGPAIHVEPYRNSAHSVNAHGNGHIAMNMN